MIMNDQTIVEILRRRAEEQADRLAFVFLEDGTVEAERWSYGDLDRRARAIAARIGAVASPGDRALLLYPAGLDFLAGFFGCLYAGLIATPAPPPEASRLKRTGPRLRANAEDAQASLVLTTGKIRGQIDGAEPPVFDPGKTRWIETEAIREESAVLREAPAVPPARLAYLQYTSGSTSIPKGVMIRHDNLTHHLGNLQKMCGYGPDSVTVTWMPYFHDYGLVEGLLEPLYSGTPCYVMSPFAFIKRPVAWLQAITRYRGTHSQAPNFAYDLCVRRTNAGQRADLDLRNWISAGNAAEPINPRVMR